VASRELVMGNMRMQRTVELKIPSEQGYEKMAMNLAADLATMMRFPQGRIEDLRTAVSEACINAIEHGNANDTSTRVYIVMTVEDDRLAIDVVDEGRSGPPPVHVSPPDLEAQIAGLIEPGGMGLFVIKALVDEADFVEPELGTGTKFRMVVHLEPKDGALESGAGTTASTDEKDEVER
jgi:serine/threonine-protein kinase RsbW